MLIIIELDIPEEVQQKLNQSIRKNFSYLPDRLGVDWTNDRNARDRARVGAYANIRWYINTPMEEASPRDKGIMRMNHPELVWRYTKALKKLPIQVLVPNCSTKEDFLELVMSGEGNFYTTKDNFGLIYSKSKRGSKLIDESDIHDFMMERYVQIFETAVFYSIYSIIDVEKNIESKNLENYQ